MRRHIRNQSEFRLAILVAVVFLWVLGGLGEIDSWGQQLKPLVEPAVPTVSEITADRNLIFQPLETDSLPAIPSPFPFYPASDDDVRKQLTPLNELAQSAETDVDLISFFDTIQVEDFHEGAISPLRVYRNRQNILELASYGDGDLGWASLIGTPYLKRGESRGLTFGMSHHFLSGPKQVDLNPRLHELVLGYQARTTFRDRLSLDLAVTVGFYSDFKGSAREGLRLPGHAVAIFHASHRMDWVIGVDYLDRQDYRLLPVFGISWHDFSLMSLRYDLVFPRPRIELTLNNASRIYLQGNLGGGTWDIELADGTEDLMTYRDYRILWGFEKRFLDGSRRGIEFGYAFGRRLQLSDSVVTLDFGNSVLCRLISSF